MSDLHPNVQQVVAAAAERRPDIEPRRFPDGTKTAADAAAAIGVDVGQIVKSLIFAVDGEVVLAYVSGANQLDEHKLAAAAGGAKCSRVDADVVRAVDRLPDRRRAAVRPRHRTLPVFVDPDLLDTTRCGRRPARGTTCSPSRRPTWSAASGGTVVDLAGERDALVRSCGAATHQ